MNLFVKVVVKTSEIGKSQKGIILEVSFDDIVDLH